MAAITLQNVKDSFGRLKQDIGDVDDDDFIEWCQFMGEFIYNEIYGVDPESFISEQTFSSITSGDQTAPTGFESLKEFGTGVFEVDQNGALTSRELTLTGPGSQVRGYYFEGTTIVFTGIAVAETFILRYIPTHPIFTALTEYFTLDLLETGKIIIDRRYRHNMVMALDTLYEQWDQNPGAELVADQRFVRALGNLLGTVKKTPNVYGLDYPGDSPNNLIAPRLV